MTECLIKIYQVKLQNIFFLIFVLKIENEKGTLLSDELRLRCKQKFSAPPNYLFLFIIKDAKIVIMK